MRKVAFTAFLALVLAGVGLAQGQQLSLEEVANEFECHWVNGTVVPGGGPDSGPSIWDNSALRAWWSGVTTGYINLDWGKLPLHTTQLPDHVVDGFKFKYGTNNRELTGESIGVFFFDSCTGWGNLGIQEAGFSYAGLPNGRNLPTLPPGRGWVWSITIDLEGSGYEFLLNHDFGLGLSRQSTPTMGSTGTANSYKPSTQGNGPTGTQNAFDIYYPNGTYNGSWWFGSSAWASWAAQLFGTEGEANMTIYGQNSQGNDAALYATGSFADNSLVHFMVRKKQSSLTGRLFASLQVMNQYYGGAYDVTRLVGQLVGGTPYTMQPIYVGDFDVYDLTVPSPYGTVRVYFQAFLTDPPITTPPMDGSNGIRAN